MADAPIPLRRDQTKRRREILQAARELAYEGGYEAVTIRAVSERACVAHTTTYRYFEHKDSLLMALSDELIEEAGARMRDTPFEGTLAERVGDLLAWMVKRSARAPRLTEAVFAAATAETLVNDPRFPEVDRMGDLIAPALHPGELIDEDVMLILGNVYNSVMLQLGRGLHTPEHVTRLLRVAARSLLRAPQSR